MDQSIVDGISINEENPRLLCFCDDVERCRQSHTTELDDGMHRPPDPEDRQARAKHIKSRAAYSERADIDLQVLFKDVKLENHRFLAAMKEFEESVEPRYKVGMSTSETHSIDDVIKAVDDAKTAYEEKGQKGHFHLIRKAFRKLGNNTDACASWLGLLPAETEYLSIICGGIKLILGAAKQLRKINDEIVEALIQIPTILNKNARAQAVFKPSASLEILSSALYIAILHCLGRVLEYYKQRAMKKIAKALFTQGSFQESLSDKIGAIIKCNEAVDDEIKLCSIELAKETNQVVKTTEVIAVSIYEKTDSIQVSVRNIQQGLSTESKEAKTRAEDIMKMNAELFEVNQQQTAILNEHRKDLLKVQALLEENLQLKKRLLTIERPASATKIPKDGKLVSSNNRAAKKTLLACLNYDKNAPHTDLVANLEHAMGMSLGEQDRAVYMMQSNLLKTWLKSLKSSALLVNGGAYSTDSNRSALSFVCAKLSSALLQARKLDTNTSESHIINLHFFCGEHVDWRDNLDNVPAGILNSLISQLLASYRNFDFTIIEHLSMLDSDNVKELGHVFSKLLRQLPGDMLVFCVIDGLAFYDDNDRREDAEKLAKILIKLSRPRKAKGVYIFKLLLTAITELHLSAVEELDEEKKVLRIPEGLEKRGGFTDMKWDLGAGQDIAELSK